MLHLAGEPGRFSERHNRRFSIGRVSSSRPRLFVLTDDDRVWISQYAASAIDESKLVRYLRSNSTRFSVDGQRLHLPLPKGAIKRVGHVATGRVDYLYGF